MKNVKIVLLLLAVCSIFSFSCKKAEDPTPPGNHQPGTPGNPIPSDAVTNISITTVLSWSCSDPDNGDSLVYEIYFGTVNPPNTILVSNWKQTNYALTLLDFNTTYYWRVTAHDNKGASSVGPIWRFTTQSDLPVEGLVAYFPFNGNANDESGNSYNGIVHSATLVSDRFGSVGNAYRFNGSNSYIEAQNTQNLNFTSGGFTIVGWCKYTANNMDNAILGKHKWGQGNGDYIIESFENKLCFFLQQNDPVQGARLTTNELYNDGQWHFIAGVYNGVTQTLFVDGTIKKSKNAVYEGSNNENIRIGAVNGGSYFNGDIDDIRIYNRPLSETELIQLYHEKGWTK